MSLVMVRGKGMPWYYLCDNCQNRLFRIEDRLSKACIICGEKTKMPDEMILCNSCSYETKMCMGCGGPIEIGDDYETMMEKAFTGKVKGRRRKNRKNTTGGAYGRHGSRLHQTIQEGQEQLPVEGEA